MGWCLKVQQVNNCIHGKQEEDRNEVEKAGGNLCHGLSISSLL